jgi:uncharacterized protein YpmB
MRFILNNVKVLIPAILVIFLIFLGFQAASFWLKRNDAYQQLKSYQEELASSASNLANLKADLNYYLNPLNFAKEIKDRLNYRQAGEKMIIIVPR